MLRQALVRIDSLEKKNAAIQAAMKRETTALREDVKELQGENRALKWSLKQLASEVKEGWEYPKCNSIRPDEYWQRKGFDEEYISTLNDDFIGGIQSAVSNLVHGVCDHIFIGGVEDSELILHDSALEPHRNILLRHLHDANPEGVGMAVHLMNIQLNKRWMGLLCDKLRWGNIREVSFFHINFTNMRHAILALGCVLKSNVNIKAFGWIDMPIETVDDMVLFTQMLSNGGASLDELAFVRNGNENTQALLASVDLSNYKKLDFEENNLRTSGLPDISNLIASSSKLETLDLGSNSLNDDDAVLIAGYLGHNTHLRRLDLTENNIQERGLNALMRAVNDTSSLNSLSDSNHSCRLGGLYRLVMNENQCEHLNRIFKIHHLMAERYRSGEGNVQYLNREIVGSNSVLLAPFIIESVHRRHAAIEEGGLAYSLRDTSLLGLLYELVKDWEMPDLFSFNN